MWRKCMKFPRCHRFSSQLMLYITLSSESSQTHLPQKFHLSKMFKVIVFLSVVALSCAFIVSYGSVDVHDEQVIEAANAATKALSKQFSSKNHHKLAKVLKARKESSLGGHNFQMDIVVGETTCKKEEYAFEDLAECEYRTNQSTFKKCIVTVFRDNDGSYKVGAKGCILATKKEIEGIV